MLNILVIEDEPLLASTLRGLVELNPRYKVTGIADDLPSALAAAEAQRPDLALVDLQLANSTSGFSVAAKLHDMGVLCLFTTGKVPAFPLPDLAIGCLAKPFEEADLVRALAEAEDILRGRPKVVLRRRLPERLELYSSDGEAPPPSEWSSPVRSRTSAWARLRKWVTRPSSFRSAAGR